MIIIIYVCVWFESHLNTSLSNNMQFPLINCGSAAAVMATDHALISYDDSDGWGWWLAHNPLIMYLYMRILRLHYYFVIIIISICIVSVCVCLFLMKLHGHWEIKGFRVSPLNICIIAFACVNLINARMSYVCVSVHASTHHNIFIHTFFRSVVFRLWIFFFLSPPSFSFTLYANANYVASIGCVY